MASGEGGAVPAATAAADADPGAVATAWQEVALTERRSQLQKYWEAIQQRGEAGKASRDAVVARLTAFRATVAALPPDDAPATAAALAEAQALIAMFQEAMDATTRRARYAEKAYEQVHTLLMSAPDPAPTLASGVAAMHHASALSNEVDLQVAEARRLRGRADELASEAVWLRGELARVQSESAAADAELSKLRNQDITIRELSGRLEEFERTVEDTVALRLLARESELRRAFDEQLEAVRESETALEARNAALQVRVGALAMPALAAATRISHRPCSPLTCS